MKLKIIIFILTFQSLYSCLAQKNVMSVKNGEYFLQINTKNLQLSFKSKNENVLVPADSISGLFLNNSPVQKTEILEKTDSMIKARCTTAEGLTAMVELIIKNGISTVNIEPERKGKNKVSLRFGGMPVAHGLGDAGGWNESFNLAGPENKTFNMINNGGTMRWQSTFVFFPKNKFAGVFFNRGKKSVVLSDSTYQMNTEIEGKSTFYFFTGEPKEIYANYKKIRKSAGYDDIQPKSRLFELGWESWDALGYNTNQETVKNILQKFLSEGYPIRWAVTGSGFWHEGGTTTSFGRYGENFPNTEEFKSWMNQNDIYWMIGLRTNLVPSGGPYYPVTKKRNKNLKVNFFYGNNLSDEALAKNLLLTDEAGKPLLITSNNFPIVPCYLIDGNKPRAAEWFQENYAKWKVDGIKEDTMMDLGEETTIFNKPIAKIANEGALVMARCGEFSAPGTLLRINDTKVGDMSKRAPLNYLQYAACGVPNVYSDVAGVYNMHNLDNVDASIRHAWLLSLTAGMAVGVFPDKWTEEKHAAFKKAVDFHYALVPYLYSAGMKSYETGFPSTLTPLSIAFPNDENVMDLKNFQWMIGNSILAAPILKNHKIGKMDIYLPEGKWFDWESQEEFIGPTTLFDYEIALDKIPCFVGGDGIVLLRNPNSEKMKVRVYRVNKKAKEEFFSLENSKKYKVEVLASNLNKVEVWDLVSNKSIPFKNENNYIEFEITEGHNYSVR